MMFFSHCPEAGIVFHDTADEAKRHCESCMMTHASTVPTTGGRDPKTIFAGAKFTEKLNLAQRGNQILTSLLILTSILSRTSK